MKDKLEKMLAYLDLVDYSKSKEDSIIDSPYYRVFGNLRNREKDLSLQKKVTKRLLNRLQTLKLEL